MASGSVSTGYVCRKCLEDHPGRIDLLTHKCFAERAHSAIPRVQAQWTERRQLERVTSAGTPISSIQSASVRPMPRVDIPGRFTLCDGKRCKGESCTYAHSIEERDAWNRQKNSGHSTFMSPHAHDSKLESRRSRKLSEPIHSAKLPRGQQPQHLDFIESPRSDPRGPTNSLSQPEESAEFGFSYSTMLQRAQPQQYMHPCSAQPRALPREERLYEHQVSEPAHSVAPRVVAEHNQLSDPLYQSTERDPAFGYHLSDPVHSSMTATKQDFTFQYQLSDDQYHFPAPSRKHKRKKALNRQSGFLLQSQLASATESEGSQPHSPPKDDWPDLSPQVSTQPRTPPWSGSTTTPESQYATSQHQPVYTPPKGSLHELVATSSITKVHYAAKQPTFEKRRAEPLQIAIIQRELTRRNYQEKFHNLLCWEEMAHIHILDHSVCGKLKLQPGFFFTHILLDEGAQMREPEGVAPLCMAGKHTKIVIAGDQHQVGPAMLVLGDEAQENGLAVSLLERLQRQYSAMGATASRYCATLVTNYRCHKDILKLVEKLFYASPLECRVPRTSTHPHARFPLRFVCSSIDDKADATKCSTYEKEASIALEEAARFAKDWPEHRWGKQDLSQVCFMSSARSQVTVAGNLVKKMPHKLYELRRHPTYDIQGREFRALVLSTSEPTWENGATCNPTKSICDPYVFNTAITSAQSLVVSVGNPFILLKTESHMIRKYGERDKCWSQYLKTCLDNGSVSIHSTLNVPEPEEKKCLQKLLGLVEEQLSRSPEISKTGDFASEDTHSTETLEGSSSPHPKPGPHNLVPGQSSEKGHLWDSRFQRDYEVKHQLGKGGFGVVYHVRNKLDAIEYAIKLIRLPSSQSDQEKVLKEVRVLAKLSHERIVRYHASWTEKAPPNWKEKKPWSILESSSETSPWADHSSYTATDDSSPPATPSSASSHSYSTDASVGAKKAEQEPSSSDSITFHSSVGTPKDPALSSAAAPVVPQGAVPPICLFIQTELCREENLKKWLQNHIRKRRRKTVMDIFSQILEGVCYIHKMGLIHRDLKPSNIFFSEDGSIKVGDFGLVTGSLASAKSLTPPMGAGSSHSSLVGTFHYMSPEQLAGDRYNQKVDIYAMGVIFFELNCCFATQTERAKVLMDLRHATLPPTFVEYLPHEASVILELLADNPSERPAAQEIADSALLKQLKSTIENKSSRLKYVPQL